MSVLDVQLNEPVANWRRIPLFLVDATDVKTPEGGQTGYAWLQMNGASWVSSLNRIVEPSNPITITTGGHYLELDASEVQVIGFLLIYYKASATASFMASVQITNAPSQANFSAILSRLVAVEQGVDQVIFLLGGTKRTEKALTQLSIT